MAIMIHYWTNQIEKIMEYYIDKLAFELEYREPSDGVLAQRKWTPKPN